MLTTTPLARGLVAALLGLALSLVAGRARADECVSLADAQTRWGEEEWRPATGRQPAGRGANDHLSWRGRLPEKLPLAAALVIDVPTGLDEVTIDGAPRAFEPTFAFAIPLVDADAGRTVVLSFRSRKFIAPEPICVARGDTSVARMIRLEILQFVVGAALVILGVTLLAATLVRRRRSPEYLWLGVFALPTGLISLAQATPFRVLLGFPAPVFYAFQYWSPFFYTIGLARFVLHVFGDTKRRLLHRASLAMFGFFVLALLLDTTDVMRFTATRPLTMPVVMAIGVLAIAHVVKVRREPGARTFLVGFVLLFALALPDLFWAMNLPLFQTNLGPYGVLVFVLALVSIVERRFRLQRDALVVSSAALEERATELAAQQRALESANEELRHQVEARSRELKLALAGSRRIEPAKAVAPVVGQVFGGRYVVDRVLGAGAMGAVYLVRRRSDNKTFALKVALGALDAEAAARMAREAEIAAKIRDPNLVSVVDVGLDDAGAPYLVMEYVEGRTLAEASGEYGQRAWALAILAQIARGLRALHAHGVVHRDMKPANVLLTRTADGAEQVKISDFGIARLDDSVGAVSALAMTLDPAALPAAFADAKLTATGELIGTPLYMAPEAARSSTASAAGDVFAFGLLAYELLVGKYPFELPPVLRAMSGLPMASLAWPSDVDVPRTLRAAIEAALSSTPDARPTAAALAEVLA